MRSVIIFVAVLALAGLAGCSEDHLLNPQGDPGKTPVRMSSPSVGIGPSEIVLCIDVSDSISASELEAVVNGLGGCLSNPDLIPNDGRMTIVITVYGDTVATALNATPVTPDNLQNAIQPALQGLLSNRLVGGAHFDLSGALENALTVLNSASVTDRHVLIVGSGAADNPGAVTSATQALAAAHVMISALAVGADAAGAALLKSCADATGGFFGTGVSCEAALGFALEVEIDLEPKTKALPRNALDTLTATVFRDGDPQAYPLAGLVVVIDVVSGPNAAIADTSTTDVQGMARLIYKGAGGPGTDIIVASVVHPGTGQVLTDTATVTWINTPPTCDAGGPYAVVVTSDVAKVTLDASGSSDADGDPLTFTWSASCSGASFDDVHAVSPVLTLTGDCLCVDSVMAQVTVSDGFDSTTCQAAVRIDDQRPPVIVMRQDPMILWAPNHKYNLVMPQMMIVSARDACGVPIDVSGALVIQVSSDEPDDANGDGKTINDIRVTCPNRVELRAERMGGGNGRVYQIVYRIFAANGKSADGVGLVVVPHDASRRTAIDDGSQYVVTPECGRALLTARNRGH